MSYFVIYLIGFAVSMYLKFVANWHSTILLPLIIIMCGCGLGYDILCEWRDYYKSCKELEKLR